MDKTTDSRTVGELLSELSRQTATLVRQEVALARSELTRNIARLGRHATLIAGGALLGYAAVLTIVSSLVLGLVRAGVTPWLAALIAGGVILLVSYLLIHAGLTALRRDQITPQTTVETLKENAEWAKNQVR